MLQLVDYGAGNLKSVEKALEKLGEKACVTGDPDRVEKADAIILPGVGAFGDAMEKLDAAGMSDAIRTAVKRGAPLLGICLGQQLLFDESEESPGVRGLGLLPGKIVRLPGDMGLKIPHMGWNDIKPDPKSRLFRDIKNGTYVYFVHSFYLPPEGRMDVAAETVYGVRIAAAVECENVFACQFHPEKSSDDGLAILSAFIRIANGK